MQITIYNEWSLVFSREVEYFSFLHNKIKIEYWEIKLSNNHIIEKDYKRIIVNWKNIKNKKNKKV